MGGRAGKQAAWLGGACGWGGGGCLRLGGGGACGLEITDATQFGLPYLYWRCACIGAAWPGLACHGPGHACLPLP